MTTNPHLVITPEVGLDTVAELAAQLRVDSILSSTAAGSGHPTSSMSAADLLAVLVTRHLHYDWDEPGAVDCYSIKPIDTATLTEAATATAGRIVIAEDHHPEGGLGSAVTDALLACDGQGTLTIAHLAVRELPGSGSGTELLAWAGIDAHHIVVAARNLIAGRRLAPEES